MQLNHKRQEKENKFFPKKDKKDVKTTIKVFKPLKRQNKNVKKNWKFDKKGWERHKSMI